VTKALKAREPPAVARPRIEPGKRGIRNVPLDRPGARQQSALGGDFSEFSAASVRDITVMRIVWLAPKLPGECIVRAVRSVWVVRRGAA
jgi:hypothetical protein